MKKAFQLQMALAGGEDQWEAKIKMHSLITFPQGLLVQCPGHVKLHTSIKTKSHKCLAVGTSAGDRERNLQHNVVKEFGIGGQRSEFCSWLLHMLSLGKYC